MIDLGNKEIVILDDNQYTFAQVDTNYKVPSFQRTVPQEKVLEKVHLIDVPKVSEIQCDGKIGIRHFDFISLLGKGSFGNVYKVRCKINCRIYALK
jgi:serine/threonine protein kinase